MKGLTTNLCRMENAVIAIGFIIMSCAAFAQVVNRNLIGAGISWFDELARYCMVYMTLLATEAGLRDGTQICITAVTDKCPPVLRRLLRVIVKVLIIGFSVTIFMTSLELIQRQISSGQVSAGLELPMYIPYLALPIGFGIVTVVQTVVLLMLIKSPLDEKKEGGAA